MPTLSQLHVDIDLRVHKILENRSDWLCQKGCDHCCRRLADVPILSLAEWNLLREGLTDLPPQKRQEIRRSMAALTRQPFARCWIFLPALVLSMRNAQWRAAPTASTCSASWGYIAQTSNAEWKRAPWTTWCGATTMPLITGLPALAKLTH
jgi:hypothetical protein